MTGTNRTHLIHDQFGRPRNIDICSEVEPDPTWSYMLWIQPSIGRIRVRNHDNTGWITVGGNGGGGAPLDAQYLCLALNAELTKERRLVAGDGLQATDSGQGADYTLNIDAGDLAGAGLEDDGAENLRIAAAAAGDGLQGGGGNALAVDSSVVRTAGDQTIAGEKTFTDRIDVVSLEMADAVELTISGGEITRTQVYHVVDTEDDAETDNLDTINGGVEGDLLIIRSADATREIVVRHNVGNIWLSGEANIILNAEPLHLPLIYNAALGKWCDICWNRATVHDHSDLIQGGSDLRPLSIDVGGNPDAIILDADSDTTLSSPVDDEPTLKVGGADTFVWTSTAMRSLASICPDLGTTTAAEMWGHIYQAAAKDILGGRIIERGSWYDFSLISSAEGDHFRQNAAEAPWTEVNAAAETNTTKRHSFWYLRDTNANALWKYRHQTGVTLESLAANAWMSFMFGPFLFRDGGYTADLSYYMGIYRNNAGVIDEATYSRIQLYWNSASAIWQIRGEEKDGSTAHNGAWVTLTQPIHQPLYLRMVVQNAAGKGTRQYWGTSPIPESHSLLQSQAPTSAPTWGQVWLQIHRTRGTGVEDYTFLGAVDYLLGAG